MKGLRAGAPGLVKGGTAALRSMPAPFLARPGLLHNAGTVREQDFFTESETTKPARLNCPYCREVDDYPLRWVVRKKKNKLPRGADERDRARFQKVQSYMVLKDDRIGCSNLRCRRRFEISGMKTTAFL